MNRGILTGLLIIGVMVGDVWAGKPLVAESPINDHIGSGCLSISTFAWTAIPASVGAGRVGLYVTVRSTAVANMGGNFDNLVSTMTKPIIFKPGITQYHGISDQEPLYLTTENNTAEDACYIEVRQ